MQFKKEADWLPFYIGSGREFLYGQLAVTKVFRDILDKLECTNYNKLANTNCSCFMMEVKKI